MAKAGEKFADDVIKFVESVHTKDRGGNYIPVEHMSILKDFVEQTAEIISKNGVGNTDERLVAAARKMKTFDEFQLGNSTAVGMAFLEAKKYAPKANPFANLDL